MSAQTGLPPGEKVKQKCNNKNMHNEQKKKETKQNKQDTWREKQCHENIADCYSSDKCCHCDLRLRVTQWDWRVSKLLRYDIDNI